jgi:hypothetical protein
MSAVTRLKKKIDDGIKGLNKGIPCGLNTVDNIIYGIQRAYIYTLGADTSGGKTSFAIDIFVYNVLKNTNKPVNILYYSFEMAETILYAKLLSLYIYDNFNEVVTFEEILSLNKELTKEHEELIEKSYPWLESIEGNFTIFDRPLKPSEIFKTTETWLERFGTFVKIDEHRCRYDENNTNELNISIIDNVQLIGGLGTNKEKIQRTAKYSIYFRDIASLSTVFIQQMNRNSKSMDRKLHGYELFSLDDFKDSSDTTDASEVVMALYYPYREKIATCEGYPIENILKHRFRLLQIIKNRYGRSDLNKGLIFWGELGLFNELEKPENITNYAPIMELDHKNLIEDKPIKEDKKENKETKINFIL